MNELDDGVMRTLIIFVMVAWATLWLLGGFLTRVGGSWRDGDKLVVLHQWGPRVWGRAEFPGGHQSYRGWVRYYRHVRLKRRDSGQDHLTSLGFTAEQAPALHDQVMAHVDFRAAGNVLKGQFCGRRFSFDADNKKIKSVAVLAPEERVWIRPQGGQSESR